MEVRTLTLAGNNQFVQSKRLPTGNQFLKKMVEKSREPKNRPMTYSHLVFDKDAKAMQYVFGVSLTKESRKLNVYKKIYIYFIPFDTGKTRWSL